MEDKRELNREKFQSYLIVTNTISFEPLGFLQDISQKGIRIKSQIKLTSQQNFNLSIKLLSKINDKDCIDFNASCVWSKPDKESFINGFIINNISDKNLIALQKLIHNFN